MHHLRHLKQRGLICFLESFSLNGCSVGKTNKQAPLTVPFERLTFNQNACFLKLLSPAHQRIINRIASNPLNEQSPLQPPPRPPQNTRSCPVPPLQPPPRKAPENGFEAKMAESTNAANTARYGGGRLHPPPPPPLRQPLQERAARQASLLSSISRGKKPCFLQNSPRPYADGQGCRSAACPPPPSAPLRCARGKLDRNSPHPAPPGTQRAAQQRHGDTHPPPPGRAGRRRGRTHLPLPARLCGCGGSAAAHPPCAAAAPRPPFSPQPGPAGFSEVPAETRRLLRGFGRFRRGHKAWRGGVKISLFG